MTLQANLPRVATLAPAPHPLSEAEAGGPPVLAWVTRAGALQSPPPRCQVLARPCSKRLDVPPVSLKALPQPTSTLWWTPRSCRAAGCTLGSQSPAQPSRAGASRSPSNPRRR